MDPSRTNPALPRPPKEGDDLTMTDIDTNSATASKTYQRGNHGKTNKRTAMQHDEADEHDDDVGTRRDTGIKTRGYIKQESYRYSSKTDTKILLDELRQKDEKIQSLERQLEEKDEKIQSLKRQHEEKEDSCRKLKEACRELQETCRELQDNLLQTLESPIWTPPDDFVTTGRLEEFAKEAGNWSRTEGLALESFEQINKSQVNGIVNSDILRNVLSVQLSDKCISKVKVHILLEALLQSFVSSIILDDWSFFLHRRLGIPDAVESKPFAIAAFKVLSSAPLLFKELEKCDPRKAHILRAEVLRTFYPPKPMNGETGPEIVRKLIDDAIRDQCSNLSKRFLQQVSPLLNHPYPATVETQLQTIFESIGKFSYQLWTQTTLFMTRGLGGNDPLPPEFRSDSEAMQNHTVHLNISQDNPTALDGWQVALVVQPAVIRKGNQKGFDPNIETVLKKAVVILTPSS